jgi:flagellar hook-associated protein 1 FlgK
LTDNVKAVSTSLTDTINTQNDSLVPLTDSINTTLKNIAQLNDQIKTANLVGGNTNEVRDQRDQLVRDLSQQIGVTYTENSDGTTDLQYKDGGAALVTGSTSGAFSLTTNAVTGLYDVNVTPPGGVAAIVIPATGQLGATLALRDTIIPGYLAKVDDLASTIASQVNTQHHSGFDLSGVAGVDFFTGTTAATISLNSAGITGTNKIAASGNPLLLGDNSNSLAMAQLQGQKTCLQELLRSAAISTAW